MSHDTIKTPARGRGALENPTGRFERLEIQCEPESDEPGQIKTELFKDTSHSIISYNDSPDVGFSASLNPYRGCEHGCIYCFARPTHEYLGLSAGQDFESKIFVKMNAAALLRKELAAKSWKPQVMAISGVTDCYQPVERKLGITRGCLEVLAEFRNPAVIITKNHLVTRDIDILSRLAEHQAVKVMVSITTLDPKLARVMEPRASRPDLRVRTVRELSEAGIPVGVMMAPLIPGLTDDEIPHLLETVAQAGANSVHYTILRLPYGVKDLFQTWLEQHVPLKKNKVLHRIMEMRDGKLNDPEFGSRMRGNGAYAESIAQLFALSRKRFGFNKAKKELSTASFRKSSEQFSLF